jgi:hypothetical protein
MSSLWTPEGEHRVAPESADATPTSSPSSPAEAIGANSDELSEEEVAAEMAALERELVAAPVEDVIANHCYGLFQLAALHLSQRPPNLEEARLAIDALGAIVEGLGPRLSDQADPLTEGLAQIRLAFVQLAAAQSAADAGEEPSL